MTKADELGEKILQWVPAIAAVAAVVGTTLAWSWYTTDGDSVPMVVWGAYVGDVPWWYEIELFVPVLVLSGLLFFILKPRSEESVEG